MNKSQFYRLSSLGFTLLTFFILLSCNNEELETVTETTLAEKYIPKPIYIPSNTLEWDVSYHPNDNNITRNGVNKSHEFAVTNLCCPIKVLLLKK